MHKTLFIVSISLTIAIAVVSLIPINPQLNIHVTNLDKYVHSFMYFVLAFSWLKSIEAIKNYKYYFYQLLFIIMLYGIVIEVLQEVLTTKRHGDIKDVIANIVGLTIAGIVYKLISKKN